MARKKRKSFVELVREVGSISRVRDLSRRRIAARRRRELAPADPSAAVGQMNGFARRFAEHAERLLEKYVLPVAGNPNALANAIAIYSRELDAFAVKARPAARAAAAKASSLARKEYERIMGVVLPHVGVKTGAEAFADETVRAYQKIAADHASYMLRRVAAIELGAGPNVYTSDLVYALWLPRNRAKQVALNETEDFYSHAFALWCRRAGDEWFIWVTKRDDRVRHKHRLLDGKVFSWAEGALGGILPGQEPGCRCRALPSTAELV